ncbi:MAG: DUF3396 domain-containing protein, partial [Azoarcus sp.]|nr:DUF3396 domain-containing protein [Azoarcus sp.]
MSTAELFMTPEEIPNFVSETLADYDLYCYWEDEGAPEYGVAPYITFYLYHSEDEFLEVAHEIIELYQELQTLIDRPFQRVYNNKTENWVKATPEKLGREMLREHAKLCYKTDPQELLDGSIGYFNKYYDIKATSEESPVGSARWAFAADVRGWYSGGNFSHYTTIKITFRDGWYRDNNQQVWRNFITKWLHRLKPEHCYSGYEVGSATVGVMGAYESDVMERICADHFYGLDVDHPGKMGYNDHDDEDGYINYAHLGAGIRTPTWCFLLSPLWRNKLGKSVEEVKEALAHPDIRVTEIPYPEDKHNPAGEPALWIELGELDLYPVDKGVPGLPVLANALIKPVRCNLLQLYTLDPWAGDPNPRFDEENSPRWMARFDPDSEWPDPDLPGFFVPRRFRDGLELINLFVPFWPPVAGSCNPSWSAA